MAPKAAAAGLTEIKRLEELLSTWIATSDLSRINQTAGLNPVEVSPNSMEVLARSLKMAHLIPGRPGKNLPRPFCGEISVTYLRESQNYR